MGGGFERKPGGSSLVEDRARGDAAGAYGPGKRTLTERLGGGEPPDADARQHGEARHSARQASAEQVLAALAPRFGHPFGRVAIHAGPQGDARAKAHGAKAVAEGSDIFLSTGVDPASSEGNHVIAHEMAHVIQQTGSPTEAQAHSLGGNDLEREAHEVGQTVAAGGSATPALRTGQKLAQGYGAPEHQSMGNDVHSVLNPVLSATEDPDSQACRLPELGGLTPSQMDEQQWNEDHGHGASHSPGLGRVSDVNPHGQVAVPRLVEMLRADPFVRERERSLTVSLRNFKMKQDMAGPYLALETDPATKRAVRYDVPVSLGDMTALSGDLYGSMENMRKAPAPELVALQRILDEEARWERDIASGAADPKNAPNFDGKWDAATSWRAHPVYGAGTELGPEGGATEGDTASYVGLALNNRAHFGEETGAKETLEVKVRAGNLDALAKGPQGNFADGNEQAWVNGHARALVLARQAHALKNAVGPSAAAAGRPQDAYGHETAVPPTGLVNPAAGNAALPQLPLAANNQPLRRSSEVETFESKRNDAYVENAGSDHYLTDAFAAGHQVVRDVVAKVTDKFVKDKGGRDAFLEFVVLKIQQGAVADSEKAPGDLGKFQDASHGWKAKAARGDSWLNSKWNPGRIISVGGDGLKQQLEQQIDDTKLHGIGAKVVHDYYNRRGVIVHNRKGMTFLIKGDGASGEAPQARQIIAMAVLESRNQITEMANTSATSNPMDVWDYTPDIDKTAFTQSSGINVMNVMFADGDYLWHLIKDNFSAGKVTSTEGERVASSNDPTQQGIRGPGGDGAGSRAPADVGIAPIHRWLNRRQDYVREQAGKTQPKQEHGAPPVTMDGVTLPTRGNG